MSKYIPGNQKHLIFEDRIYIENELNKGISFKDIARFLRKDPTTISKKVRAHSLSDWYQKGTFYNAKNFCIHRYHREKTNACGKIVLCGIKCTFCPTCNQTCRGFEKNAAQDLTGLLISATAIPKRSATTPSPTNTLITPGSLTENTAKSSGIPGPEQHDEKGAS